MTCISDGKKEKIIIKDRDCVIINIIKSASTEFCMVDITIKKKLIKIGGSYGIVLPKNYVDHGILKHGSIYYIRISDSIEKEPLDPVIGGIDDNAPGAP